MESHSADFHPGAAELMRGGNFAPRGHLAESGDLFACCNREGATGTQCVCSGKGQGWPGAGQAPTAKNYLALNVSGAEAEKLPGKEGFIIYNLAVFSVCFRCTSPIAL